jgi:hypothetical protein
MVWSGIAACIQGWDIVFGHSLGRMRLNILIQQIRIDQEMRLYPPSTTTRYLNAERTRQRKGLKGHISQIVLFCETLLISLLLEDGCLTALQPRNDNLLLPILHSRLFALS